MKLKKFLFFILMAVVLFGCAETVPSEKTEESVNEPVMDEPELTPVPEPEMNIIFTLEMVTDSAATEISYDSPYVQYNTARVNVENMPCGEYGLNVIAEDFAEYREIYIKIGIEDWKLDLLDDTDITEVSELAFINIVNFINTAVKPADLFKSTVYSIGCMVTGKTDNLEVINDNLYIDGVNFTGDDCQNVILDEVRTIFLNMDVDISDQFFFMDNVFYDFFGFGINAMTWDELMIFKEIIEAYPETGVLDLAEVYNP